MATDRDIIYGFLLGFFAIGTGMWLFISVCEATWNSLWAAYCVYRNGRRSFDRFMDYRLFSRKAPGDQRAHRGQRGNNDGQSTK